MEIPKVLKNTHAKMQQLQEDLAGKKDISEAQLHELVPLMKESSSELKERDIDPELKEWVKANILKTVKEIAQNKQKLAEAAGILVRPLATFEQNLEETASDRHRGAIKTHKADDLEKEG